MFNIAASKMQSARRKPKLAATPVQRSSPRSVRTQAKTAAARAQRSAVRGSQGMPATEKEALKMVRGRAALRKRVLG